MDSFRKTTQGASKELDCFRLRQTATADRSPQARLAMTLMVRSITSHSRDTLRPSFAKSFAPKTEGAGKTGCALHPRSHVQGMHKQTHMSIQVQRKQSGLPCAMVLTAYFVLSPARPGFLSPSLPRSLLLKNLTPTTGASGSHDFAVRTTIARLAILLRPPLPAPTSVTMANAPLSGRDSFNKQVIWV